MMMRNHSMEGVDQNVKREEGDQWESLLPWAGKETTDNYWAN